MLGWFSFMEGNKMGYFEAMTDGCHSRREYKKLRRAGVTPEQNVLDILNGIQHLDLGTDTKWIAREIEIVKRLLPISKFE
jgi:hypothetical protein